MATIVGLVDQVTEVIWDADGLGDHKSAPYVTRVAKAHAAREADFRASLSAMKTKEANGTWDAQKRAVNGAAEVLAAYRRNYADAHGAKAAEAGLVEAALHAAIFVIYSLSD